MDHPRLNDTCLCAIISQKRAGIVEQSSGEDLSLFFTKNEMYENFLFANPLFRFVRDGSSIENL